MVPSDSTARSTGGTLISPAFWLGSALGRVTLILCDIKGAVIMKMISSTSITSTRGVTLISDIGPPLLLLLKAILQTLALLTRRNPAVAHRCRPWPETASCLLLETDLLNVVAFGLGQHPRDVVVRGDVGGGDLHFRLLIFRLGSDHRELRLQLQI